MSSIDRPQERNAERGERRIPILRTGEPRADPETALAALRRFHLGRPAAGDDLARADECLPVSFDPYRDSSRVSYEYPLFLSNHGPKSGARPLRTVLEETAATKAVPEVLRDNLPRVERWIRSALDGAGSAEARPWLVEAGDALCEDLALAPESDARLRDAYADLLDAMPEDGALVGFDPNVPLRLLLRSVRKAMGARREKFAAEVRRLVDRMRSRLEVEARKDPETRDTDAVTGSIGTVGGQHLDAGVLASLIGPYRGSAPMAADERRWLTESLETLESFGDFGQPLALVVHAGSLEGNAVGDLPAVEEADPFAGALDHHARFAGAWSKVFRAVRVGRLVVSGKLDVERMRPWIEGFDAQSFSEDELGLLPVVVAVGSANRLAIDSLSRLLRSGLPLHALVAISAETSASELDSPRLELGYLGVGHRRAFVQQASSSRVVHLHEGFERSLEARSPALHVVYTPSDASGDAARAWLVGGAAIESRAHPLFRYDPGAGTTWAGRLDFSENPAAEEDWPVHEFSWNDESGSEQNSSCAFTFADYALLAPGLSDELRLIPGGVPEESLIPVADYLALDDEEASRRIPFVWGVDGEGELRRVAISRRLALATRERLDFWCTLQELAGIRNEYVREATERIRREAKIAADAEKKELEAAHAAELERTREEAVGRAMHDLARELLDLETSRPSGEVSSAALEPTDVPTETVAPPEVPPAAVEPEPLPATEAPAVEIEEPWIDTPLCTSCNDCTAINPLVFVYDQNKQAYIGDAKAGTFAQIVQAAEKCPAKCIHPGKPSNPDEANLEELVRRAEPFQ